MVNGIHFIKLNQMIHLHKSKNKQFYFIVKAKNGKTLMTSETYKAKKSAVKGIAALIKNVFGFKDHTT